MLVLNSDKAQSLIKLGKHYVAKVPDNNSFSFIHGNCMMHMMFAALVGALQPLGLVSPLYCSTVLLRRHHNMKAVRRRVRERVTQLRRVYDPPPLDNYRANEGTVALLDAADRELFELAGDDLDVQDVEQILRRRRSASGRLLLVCPGRWHDPSDLIH